jgi:hypothetical protein
MRIIPLCLCFLLSNLAFASGNKNCILTEISNSSIGLDAKTQALDPIAEILTKNAGRGPRDLSSAVRFWANMLNHKVKPLTQRLLECAEQLKIQIEVGPIPGGAAAHYIATKNTVYIDVQKLIDLFQTAKIPLTPDRVIDEYIAHELIHGLITARVPNFDFKTGKPLARPRFDEYLEEILARLPAPTAGSRVEKVLKIIKDSHPSNRAEEIVTYSLTDNDFANFMKQSGQMAPLLYHLKRFGFSEFVP